MKITTRIICLLISILIVVPFYSCNRNDDATKVVVEYDTYPASQLIDYSNYVTLKNVEKLFGTGVYAFALDAYKYYKDGKLVSIDNCVFKTVGTKTKEYYIELSELGSALGIDLGSGLITDDELSSKTDKKYIYYDEKLIVFLSDEKASEIDVFNNIYTFEALYVSLMDTTQENIDNLFIDLPNMVSNGSTNYVYYTAPDLDLGLQTSIYYEQMGDQTVSAGPMIVAGQGKNEYNSTLVRVLNRQQSCITQFLAYPSEVTGGVQVQAVSAGGEYLIAAAPYTAKKASSKAVRVFDIDGMLRCVIDVDGINAPYTICSGKFAEGSTDDYIAVASSNQSGSSLTVLIYNAVNGALYKKVEITLSSDVVSQEIQLTNKAGTVNDELIVYYTEANKAFYVNTITASASNIDITLPDNATGVYDSAFDEIAVTMNDGTFSYITAYSSLSGSGELTNVGWRENRFYTSACSTSDDSLYVSDFNYNHIRTDLSFNLAGRISVKKTSEEALKIYDYSRWNYSMTKAQKDTYHNSYNIFEPCFTHRWNVMGLTQTLISLTDADGNSIYGSVGRDNVATNYLEGSSSFLVGTYADGLVPMAKMRLYPLRSFLNDLADEFRGANAEPEKLISVVPVHEQEIDVAGSVGDYNKNMIIGFREYLLELYGSLENINKRFGTDFETLEDFDAPRYDPDQDDESLCRGEWDTYGESDFFTQWSLYSRYIVNKRIMEAYREALLAGFPPEAINAHSIPEGDAVSGFLGEADTRLSPVEGVTVAGTAYGATRYGVWYQDERNFINLAYKAGHNNITLGEYCALTSDSATVYAQLKYLFNHGVKAVSVLSDSTGHDKAEIAAADKLQEKNEPRTATTGITSGIVTVNYAGETYNVVQMSSVTEDGTMNDGLLKSVDEDGYWTGTVYVCPFHAYVEVKAVSVSGNVQSGYKSGKISDLQYGDQVELTFMAAYSGSGEATVTVEVYNGSYKLSDATAVYTLTDEKTPMRYVFSNEITPEDITFKITIDAASSSKVTIENLSLTAQYENIAHKYFGDLESSVSLGGVSFDVFQ